MSTSSDEVVHEGGEKKDMSENRLKYIEWYFMYKMVVYNILYDRWVKALPNPDEGLRIEMSRRIGLKPNQIEYWFQNRRTSIIVTCVDHLEVEESNHNLGVFHIYIHSGKAFGAQRRLAMLQGMTEGFYYMWMLGPENIDYGGVILTQKSRSLMSLSHSMVRSFCSSLFSTIDWIIIMESNETKIRALPNQINGKFGSDRIILNPITSVWLPFSTEQIFSFFKDESKRDLWDILYIGSIMQPITSLFTHFNMGDFISLLPAVTSDANLMLLMQETRTDSSVSMLVFASIDSSIMQTVMSGGETRNIPLFSSGVAILPSCNSSVSMDVPVVQIQ